MKTTTVKGRVIAIITEFEQLEIGDSEGRRYAAVPGLTDGLPDLQTYQQGQEVLMEVEWLGKSEGLPRIKKIAPA